MLAARLANIHSPFIMLIEIKQEEFPGLEIMHVRVFRKKDRMTGEVN